MKRDLFGKISKYMKVFAVVLAVAMLTACGGAGASKLLSGIEQRGIIRVGFKTKTPKFAFKDEDGNINGFEPELAKLLSEKITEDNVHVREVEVNSCTAYPLLQSEDVDFIVSTMAYEEGRSKSVSYSKPYYIDAAGLMCLKGGFASADDIVKGGGKIGYTNPDVIGAMLTGLQQDKKLDFEPISIASYPEAVEALKNGTIDAFCSGFATLCAMVDVDTTILPESLGDIKYCVVLSGGEQKLAEKISQTITEIEKSGELQQLLDKWGIE
ncbi:MAG: transporter substrate-binding domain-containing protein [Christensenellales bacterium]